MKKPLPWAAANAKAGAPARVTIADYQHAERMLNVGSKILNATVDAVWLPDGDRFWYKRHDGTGSEYIEVDAVRATKRPAFDGEMMARAISAAIGTSVDARSLDLAELRFVEGADKRIAFSTAGFDLVCDLGGKCIAQKSAPRDVSTIRSPDGRWAVFARSDNLWLRELATGAERQLTTDGEPHFSYGKTPDIAHVSVLTQTTGFQLPLYGVDWSPDSSCIIVDRADERRVPEYKFLQLTPYDGDRRPRPATVRLALSGEKDPTVWTSSIIDVNSGAEKQIEVNGRFLPVHYWDPSGHRFIAVEGGDLTREATIYEVSVATAAARAIFTEQTDSFLLTSPLSYFEEPAIRFLPSTNELIWYSQRDGWGHLYLIDIVTGKIKSQIDSGHSNVRTIVRVDERHRKIYFTAMGREVHQDPYWRHLYSVNLDGGSPRLLTPEPGDHAFSAPLGYQLRGLMPDVTRTNFSPDGRFFIDTLSTVEQPPVTVLRRADGALVLPLETVDASAVYAAGWSPPKPFTAKAADGLTDLYGVVVTPKDFDESRKYPVVDAIYNGPLTVTAPHDFVAAVGGAFMLDAQALAQLGFVVVVLDGRGSALRGKAFQDYLYNNMQEFAIEDHVTAIRQLANARPYMDIDRVGIYGHSFGGYAATKAILGYPDFFKVAASSAAPYDLYGMWSLEAFFEPPIFANGAPHPSGPTDRPTNWGDIDLTQQAGRLKGKLLLAYGDLDENAYPVVAARMVSALIAANKSFELIYIPNGGHGFSGGSYFIRRRWDFFVRNLLGVEPPTDYQMGSN